MNIKLFALSIFSVATLNLNAQVVINEYCTLTNKMFDDNGENSDWIELYNTGNNEVDLTGWALSDDENNLGKWAFPTVKMPAKGYLLIYADGIDCKEYSEGGLFPLVTKGDIFRYKIGNAEDQDVWLNADFDDSQWAEGESGFGFGNNVSYPTTIENGIMSVYLRKKFTIDNVNGINRLVFSADYDDGFVAYINGKEIARENLGDAGSKVTFDQATPNYVNPNGTTATNYSVSNWADVLVNGENILQIEVHNCSTTSSDLCMIPFLTAGSSSIQPQPLDNMVVLKSGTRYMHTNFSLSADGECIFLSDNTGKIVHSVDTTTVPNNISRGLSANGKEPFLFFSLPTPGYANGKGYETTETCTVKFTPQGGTFSPSTKVTLESSDNGPIYYTTDGSVPTESSKKYTEPISVTKSTVIRAITFSDSKMSGEPTTQTYVKLGRKQTLPIIAFTTDPVNLYDEEYGIWADGPNYVAGVDPPYNQANYWNDWERPINVEYMTADSGKVYETAAGLKAFGGWSRSHRIKPMAIHARKAYGSKKLKYKFFDERYAKSHKSVVMRASANDLEYTYIRDAMMTHLMQNTDMDYQAYQPMIVFLNGEYHGIMNMREKVSEHYIENLHGIDADNVDLIEGDGSLKSGTLDNFNDFKSYLNSNSTITDEKYEYLKTQMDVEEFMDYIILEVYVHNTDWPQNNVKIWRSQDEDSRWRWILYDTDFGFGLYDQGKVNQNSLARLLGRGDLGNSWANLVFRRLVTNKNFVRDFANRFCDRLNREFLPSEVNYLIDSLAGNIKFEMKYHRDHWNYWSNWDNELNNLKQFAEKRPTIARKFVRDEWNLGSIIKVNIDTEGKGDVQINTLKLKEYPWTGLYFSQNEITITAIPQPGYKFSHWSGWAGLDTITAPQLKVLVPNNQTFRAHFVRDEKDYNSVVINEINYKSSDDFDAKDWIELHNTTNATIDLSRWTLTDNSMDEAYTIPANTRIEAKGYLVICSNIEKFKKLYPDVKNVIGNFEFGLGTTDDVRLFDHKMTLIDSVSYDSESPWTSDAKGTGYTLSLSDPYQNNENAYLWEANEMHGTPGKQNGNYSTNHIDDENEQLVYSSMNQQKQQPAIAACTPNPFANSATIFWEQQADANTRIELLDAQGRIIEVLANRFFESGHHEVNVDNAESLTPGVYIVRVAVENRPVTIIKLVKE
ncbi:MAG: CotH kinase family protein [Salinivirgaceae bacterium]|nr:CotH kinase family protein [Salinivirgaceae bacterium]